ncbi:MAG: nuclear transport factor 2 family protein [Pseudomonadota bacterium]
MTQVPIEVSNFFLALQAGPHGLASLAEMFAQDAVYFEPFSGRSEPHKGREAIAAAFDASRSGAFDDAVISLQGSEIDDEKISVRWTCVSKSIPGGRGSGTNVFKLKAGLIVSLVTTLDGDGA